MATFAERYQAAMVLGGVGDSLGYKWCHYSSGVQIHDELVKLGGVDVLDIKPPDWRISSCTRMHILTARAFANCDHRASTSKLIKQIMLEYCKFKGEDKHDPFDDLFITACLFLKFHCFKYTILFYAGALGSKAAARAMCIGLRFYSPGDFQHLIEVSIESGRITHHHPVGYLGAFTTALFTSYAVQRKPFKEWGHGLIVSLPNALNYIRQSGKAVQENVNAWNDFTEKWKNFLELRGVSSGTSEPVIPQHDDIRNRDEFYKSISQNGFSGSQGRDAPMIAYDVFVCFDGSWSNLCIRSICHGGMSHVTGSIAACWYGAMFGFQGIQKRNFLEVENKRYLQAVGHLIHAIASPNIPVHGQNSNFVGQNKQTKDEWRDPVTYEKNKDLEVKLSDLPIEIQVKENNEKADTLADTNKALLQTEVQVKCETTETEEAIVPNLQTETQVKNENNEEADALIDVNKAALRTETLVTRVKNENGYRHTETNESALQIESNVRNENHEDMDGRVDASKVALQTKTPVTYVKNEDVYAQIDEKVPDLQTETQVTNKNYKERDVCIDANEVAVRTEIPVLHVKNENTQGQTDAKVRAQQTEIQASYEKKEDKDTHIDAKAAVLQIETKDTFEKTERVMALVNAKVVALQRETLSGNAIRIADTIYIHIKNFCDKISYLTPYTRTTEILKVGSFNEGTKIIQLDEFDFIAVLGGKYTTERFMERFLRWEASGNSEFVEEGLSVEQIFDNFSKNLLKVIVNKDNFILMKDGALYNSRLSEQECVPLPTVNGLRMTVRFLRASQPNIVLEFHWSNMVINVDLTPAVRTTDWRQTFQPENVVHRNLRKSILEKESLLLVMYREHLKLTMTEVEVEYMKQTLQKEHKHLYVYLKYFNGLYAKGNVFEMAGYLPFSSYMLKTFCIYHDELCNTATNKSDHLKCLREITAMIEKSLNNGYLLPSEFLKETWVGYLPSLFDKNINLYHEPTKPVDFYTEFRRVMVGDLKSIFALEREWADLDDFCKAVESHVSMSADAISNKTWSYSKYLFPVKI